MSDLDQLRAELRAAVAPPFDIHPPSDLGPVLRHRARSRRRARYAAVVAGAAVCAAVAVAAGTLADDAARTTPPAKSGDLQSPPAISLPPGPHRLDNPVEVREAIGTPPCGTVEDALESADGGDLCFQVEPPELVVRRVADLAVTVDPGDDGPADDRVVLVLTLEPDQERQYTELITPAVGRYAVLVVDGLVYSSPGLGDEAPDGKLRLTATDDGAVEHLARLLTGRPAPGTG